MTNSHNRISKATSFLFAILLFASTSWSITISSMVPANGATNQCMDTPLRMNLSGGAVLNWGGSIRIRDLGSNSVVHTWSLTSNPGSPLTGTVAATWPHKDAVGHTTRNVWPIVIDSIPNNLAEIRVPYHLLQPGKRYQIEVDAGVLKGKDGSSFPGVAAGAWTFTTRNSNPTSKASILVAEDNSGDVCSIQEAVNLVPAKSTTPVHVLVKPGYYREMIASKDKDNLRIYGAGSTKTFVRYYNSNNFNEGSSTRNLALIEGKAAHIRAITLTSTVLVTGGQAEALYLKSDQAVVANVVLQSHQDTWLNSGGKAYVENSTIEGSVDFIWGYNPVFFRNCEIVFTRAGSVVVQPRNSSTTHGYIFDRCTIRSKNTSFTANKFARDAGTSYPDGEVVWLNTTIQGSIMNASPWTVNSGMDENRLRFCEYKSKDQNGTLISITDSQRLKHQCTDANATTLSTPSNVLGGWTPSFPDIADVLAMIPTSNLDCNGVKNGSATIDSCGRCVGGNTGKTACVGSIQGESFCTANGVAESNNAGFLGTGFLNLDNTVGSKGLFVIQSSSAANSIFTFRYANGGTTDRPVSLTINGTVAVPNVSFPITGAWTTWNVVEVTVPLVAGRNELLVNSLTADGAANLDLIGFVDANAKAGPCDAPVHAIQSRTNSNTDKQSRHFNLLGRTVKSSAMEHEF